MRSWTALLYVVFVVCLAPAGAEADRLSFERTLSEEDLTMSPSRDGFEAISLAAGRVLYDRSRVGHPALPTLSLRILLPQDANLSDVSVTRSSRFSYERDVLPVPYMTPEQQHAGEMTPDPGVYESDTAYPEDAVWLADVAVMRGVKVLHVAFTPLEYNGANRELSIYRSIAIDVNYSTGHPVDGLRVRKRAVSRWTRRGLERAWLLGEVENPDDYDRFYRAGTESGDGESRTSQLAHDTSGFRPSEFPSLEGSRVEYLIITDSLDVAGRSIGNMVSELQRLADWKTERGVPAVVRTVGWIGEHYPGLDIAEKMRNFVIDAYELWGVDWLLLAGDANVVPARRTIPGTWGHGEQPADGYFGCLDGNWDGDGDHQFGEHTGSEALDVAWEVYVGRAPVESTDEAENYVNKLLSYERHPEGTYETTGSTYETVVLLSTMTNEFEWGVQNPFRNGIYTGKRIYDLVQDNLPTHTVDFYVEPIPLLSESCCFEETREVIEDPDSLGTSRVTLWTRVSSDPTWDVANSRDILNELSNGAGLVHHQAHSSPYHEGNGATGIGDVCGGGVQCRPAIDNNLLSENLTPIQIGNLSNKDRYFIMYSTGSGVNSHTQESVSESWINARDGGAVAYVGSPHSSGNFEQGHADYTFFEQLIENDVLQLGPAIGLTMQSFSSAINPQINTYQLLGDPELHAWVDTPGALSVSVSATEDTVRSLLDVTVSVDDGTNDVEGALVCLKQGESLYATGLTDASGDVAFASIRLVSLDDVLVTASAPHHWPARDTLELSTTAAHVAYIGHTFDPLGTVTSRDLLLPGDSYEVDVEQKNTSNQIIDTPAAGKLFVYGELDTDLIFNGGTASDDVWIGLMGSHPEDSDGFYHFPLWEYGIDARGEPAQLGSEEGVFIWRDIDDDNLWYLVSYRYPPREEEDSRIPINQAEGSIVCRGGFNSVSGGGLEAQDSYTLTGSDTLSFAFQGTSDYDTLKFRAESDDFIVVTDADGHVSSTWYPGITMPLNNDFGFTIDADVPDAHEFLFELHMWDDGNDYLGANAFAGRVAAPDLVLARQVVDSVGLSGNRAEYVLRPTIVNAGTGDADTVVALLDVPSGMSWSDSVEVVDGSMRLGAMLAGAEVGGGTTDSTFTFEVDPDFLDDIRLDLTLRSTSGFQAERREVVVDDLDLIGPVDAPQSVEVYATTEEGVSLSWDEENTPAADFLGYHVHRKLYGAADSTYVLLNGANPTEIRHYVDEGASRNETYTYAVAAVDQSGNEGPRSTSGDETTFATWVSVHEGWPRQMVRKGAPTSVRALDFVTDQNDYHEIFALGDMLYCWRPDGTRCFDGNQVSLPDGVVYKTEVDSTYFFDHGRYYPALTIADLDDSDGADYEVILVSMDGMVTVLDYDTSGDSLYVRWQRDIGDGSVRGAVYSAPTVVDFLENGERQVIIANERGSQGGQVFVLDADNGVPQRAANPFGCVTSLDSSGAMDLDACAFYDTDVGYSWFTPVVLPDVDNGDPIMLLAPSDGTLIAVDHDGVEHWTYTVGACEGPVSTPVVGDLFDNSSDHDIAFSVQHRCVGGAVTDSVVVVDVDGNRLGGWETPDLSEDKYVQYPVLADIVDGDDGRAEIIIGVNEVSSASVIPSRRLQRIIVIDPEVDVVTACSLYVPLPSRGVLDRQVWSQPTVMEWDTGTYRVFAGSNNFGVMSWLWDEGCSTVSHEAWKIFTGERVMGAPMIRDVDEDQDFDLVASDVGGKVWLWDLEKTGNENKILWGQHGHDPFNTFTYVSNGFSRVAPAPVATLEQNAPNPFNPRTRISFTLSDEVDVQLRVFDVSGRLVTTLVEATRPAGEHVVLWDGTDEAGKRMSSGVFFYELRAGPITHSRKMILLR